MKKISIIVPVYNVEKFLSECIDSLLCQTYKNLEILLIDDGSADQSGMICDTYCLKDSRIHVFHTSNLGVSHARNVGLDNANGDYIGFCDADDWIDSDYYKSLVEEIEENHVDIVGSGYTRETIKGQEYPLKKGRIKIFSRNDILIEIFKPTNHKILWWEACDKLFKREIISDIRFNEAISNGEDMLFFWSVMKKAKSFLYYPTYGYHYRMRNGSAIHAGLTEKKLTFYEAVKEVFYNSSNESIALKKNLRVLYHGQMISSSRWMLLLDPQKYKKNILEIQNYVKRNFYLVWKDLKGFNRKKIGMVYLLLPFKLLLCFRFFIKTETDKRN